MSRTASARSGCLVIQLTKILRPHHTQAFAFFDSLSSTLLEQVPPQSEWSEALLRLRLLGFGSGV
jgi:hypothetical protein